MRAVITVDMDNDAFRDGSGREGEERGAQLAYVVGGLMARARHSLANGFRSVDT